MSLELLPGAHAGGAAPAPTVPLHAVRGVAWLALGARQRTVVGTTTPYGPMPTPSGVVPTEMGAPTTVLVVVSITVTVLLFWLAT